MFRPSGRAFFLDQERFDALHRISCNDLEPAGRHSQLDIIASLILANQDEREIAVRRVSDLVPNYLEGFFAH